MILRMLNKEGQTTYILNLDRFMDFYVDESKRVHGEPTVVGWHPNGNSEPTENIWSFTTREEADKFLDFIGECFIQNKRCINLHMETDSYDAQ